MPGSGWLGFGNTPADYQKTLRAKLQEAGAAQLFSECATEYIYRYNRKNVSVHIYMLPPPPCAYIFLSLQEDTYNKQTFLGRRPTFQFSNFLGLTFQFSNFLGLTFDFSNFSIFLGLTFDFSNFPIFLGLTFDFSIFPIFLGLTFHFSNFPILQFFWA